MKRALELDPFNTVIQSWYSFDLLGRGRYDEAIEAARSAVETTPNHLLASSHLIVALHAKGMDKEAVNAYKAWATAVGDRKAVEILEQGYAEGGPAEAMKRLADWGEAKITTCAYDICSLYAMAGANQQALDLLERLFEEREPNMPAIGFDPTFAGLRKEPRFLNLLRQLNFPEDVLQRYREDFENKAQ
jgi:tetratricopeptide (TPR) repeat protein